MIKKSGWNEWILEWKGTMLACLGASWRKTKGSKWWERRGGEEYESMLDWIPSVGLIRLITRHQRSVRAWPASAERSLGTITLTTGFCLQTCTTRLGPFVIPFELRLARHHRSKEINCTFPRLGKDRQLFSSFWISSRIFSNFDGILQYNRRRKISICTWGKLD